MIEQHFDTPRPVRLQIRVPFGDLEVRTAEASESTVMVEGSPKLVDTTRVELSGDRLVVEQGRRTFLGFFDHFEGALRVRVRIPQHSNVEIVTASGDANLDGTFGGLEAKSSSGEVRVTGEIDGDANLKTVSGDLHLPTIAGDLAVHSVSADLVVESVAGSVSAKSVSGDVRIGSLRDGRANVQSVSGDVTLGIAPGTCVDVDAGSASGELASDIPLSDETDDRAGPTVVVRGATVSGDFRLVRAAQTVSEQLLG